MESRENLHIKFMQLPQNGKNKGTKEGEIMVKMIFRISGNPEVGKWYKMDANLNINSLENSETIELPSVGVAIENPPVESRMKDDILTQVIIFK
jgi:hypothetical protein